MTKHHIIVGIILIAIFIAMIGIIIINNSCKVEKPTEVTPEISTINTTISESTKAFTSNINGITVTCKSVTISLKHSVTNQIYDCIVIYNDLPGMVECYTNSKLICTIPVTTIFQIEYNY